MGSWVIQVIELKFDVSIDLWDHLEAAVASVATKIAITWIYQELLVPLRVQIKFQNPFDAYKPATYFWSEVRYHSTWWVECPLSKATVGGGGGGGGAGPRSRVSWASSSQDDIEANHEWT